MELYQNIKNRANAIKAMYEYHQAYKNGKMGNDKKIEETIAKLSESDRNYMLITGRINNPENVLPLTENSFQKNTLRDLVMAYHYYLEERSNKFKKDVLIIQIDQFYKNLYS